MNEVKKQFIKLFDGMSRDKIGMVICGGLLLSVTAFFLLLAIVYVLPFTDSIKRYIFIVLGFVSLAIAYHVLMTTPATKADATPIPNTQPIATHEFWRGVKSIKSIFVHKPIVPKMPIANIRKAKPAKPNTTKAFIFSSVYSYLKRVLHHVL